MQSTVFGVFFVDVALPHSDLSDSDFGHKLVTYSGDMYACVLRSRIIFINKYKVKIKKINLRATRN